MARWIPLSTFKQLFQKESDLLTPESHADFLHALQASEGENIRRESGIEQSDFLQFVASVQSPEGIVFHGWVAQSKELEKTLIHERVSNKFRDSRGFLGHTLATKFKAFISPYLAPILLHKIPDEIGPLRDYFSFVTILEDDTRAMVEMQLFKAVRPYLQSLQSTHALSHEQALIDAVKPVCSEAFIESMNYLSKRSYSLKMAYVDAVMEAIRSNACTARFANWILKQMELLELNNEHELKLIELRKELAEGKLQVKKMDSTRNRIRWRPVLLSLFILAIVGAGLFVLIFKPFSNAEVYHAYDSAKSDFTEDELAKIDSLALEIDQESFMEGRMIDPDLIIQTGTAITLRNPFKTALMERIFSDVNKDVTLKENYFTDSCGVRTDFTRYPGVKDLESRAASKEVQFRNDSDYDVIVYVSNNKSGGNVYSLLVKSRSQVTFKMNEWDVLTTVAGKKYVAFVPPVGSFSEEKPSDDFRYHFCDTDANYFESINTALQLQSTSRDKLKFMVLGSATEDYQLIDVYGVATAY